MKKRKKKLARARTQHAIAPMVKQSVDTFMRLEKGEQVLGVVAVILVGQPPKGKGVTRTVNTRTLVDMTLRSMCEDEHEEAYNALSMMTVLRDEMPDASREIDAKRREARAMLLKAGRALPPDPVVHYGNEGGA